MSFNDSVNILIVFLVALVIGTIITLFLLNWLLYPITLTANALHQYVVNKKIPKLPKNFKDTMGQLMGEVQYTIEQMELVNYSLKDSSITDSLTGLLNRRAAEERLRLDIARARREENQLLVALLKVNALKQINNKFGHHIGDDCLKEITSVLANSIRDGDWLARWGNAQFLVVLWNFNHANPTTVLERLQQFPIKISKGKLQINLNIGACEYKGDTDLDIDTDLETLLIRLEDGLSQLKPNKQGGIILIEG
ncbi:response regulator [Beggiatoa sp. PS]|nr:response regulator [Beggiatoa sp. PS]